MNGIPPALARFAAHAAAAPQRAHRAEDLEGTTAPGTLDDPAALDGGAEAASGELRPAALRAASLWEILSPEERAFFADAATLGALTYRPGGRRASPPPAPTGQRVDFKA